MRPVRTILALSLAATAALSLAQTSHVVRLKLTPGTKLSTTTIGSTKMTFSGLMDETMDSTMMLVQQYSFEPGEEGKTKFTVSTTDVKLEGGMMDQAGGDPNSIKKVTMTGTVDDRGTTSSIALNGMEEGDMMAGMVMMMPKEMFSQSGFFGLTFPEEAVSVGSKWSAKINFANILAAQSMGFLQNAKGEIPLDHEVLAFEAVDGVDCVKVKSFMDGKFTFDVAAPGMESTGSMTITGVTTAWYSLADGLLVKSESSSASVIDMGMMTINQASESKTTSKR